MLKTLLDILLISIRSHGDNRNRRSIMMMGTAYLIRSLIPVHNRHAYIHQYQLICPFRRTLKSINRFHAIIGNIQGSSFALQQHGSDLLIEKIILCQQHMEMLKVKFLYILAPVFLSLKAFLQQDVQLKGSPLAQLALHGDGAAQHVDILLHDGKPQPGAIGILHLLGFLLGEGIIKLWQELGTHADAGIRNNKFHPFLVWRFYLGDFTLGHAVCLQQAGTKHDRASRLGKLHRIAQKVQKDFLQLQLVRDDIARQPVIRHVNIQPYLPFRCRHGYAGEDFVYHVPGSNPLSAYLHLAALNARKIQGIVNKGQQQLPGMLDFFQILRPLALILRVQGKIGKGKNSVQRRAHIMADAGQEDGLGFICLVRLHDSLLQLLQMAAFRQVLPGDIALDDKDAGPGLVQVEGLHPLAAVFTCIVAEVVGDVIHRHMIQLVHDAVQGHLAEKLLRLCLFRVCLQDGAVQFLVIKQGPVRGILNHACFLAEKGHGARKVVDNSHLGIAQLRQLVGNNIVDEFVGNIIEIDKTLDVARFAGKNAHVALHHNRGQVIAVALVLDAEIPVPGYIPVHQVVQAHLPGNHVLFIRGDDQVMEHLHEGGVAHAGTKLQGVGGVCHIVQQLVVDQVKMALGQKVGVDGGVQHLQLLVILLLTELFCRDVHAYAVGISRGVIAVTLGQGIDKPLPVRRLSRELLELHIASGGFASHDSLVHAAEVLQAFCCKIVLKALWGAKKLLGQGMLLLDMGGYLVFQELHDAVDHIVVPYHQPGAAGNLMVCLLGFGQGLLAALLGVDIRQHHVHQGGVLIMLHILYSCLQPDKILHALRVKAAVAGYGGSTLCHFFHGIGNLPCIFGMQAGLDG